MKIQVKVNCQDLELEIPPDRRAVDLLREELGLTGVKEACGSGECGSCTILVDGEARLSCLLLAAQLDGQAITTIEGLAQGEELHPVQQAFVELGAVQCGYCTPGMILAAVDLLRANPDPSPEEIRIGLSGNLCRCTGYQMIVEAVAAAARTLRDQGQPA